MHEASSSVVHHSDYLNRGNDQPLCGATFEKPARLDPTIHPVAVCPDCEAKLPEYHVIWWREKAEAAIAELDELRAKYREPAKNVDDQRPGARHERSDIPPRSGPTRTFRALSAI